MAEIIEAKLAIKNSDAKSDLPEDKALITANQLDDIDEAISDGEEVFYITTEISNGFPYYSVLKHKGYYYADDSMDDNGILGPYPTSTQALVINQFNLIDQRMESIVCNEMDTKTLIWLLGVYPGAGFEAEFKLNINGENIELDRIR